MAIVHLCDKENSTVLWSYAYVNENFQLGDVFSWNCIIFNGFFLMFLLHTWRITACLMVKSFFFFAIYLLLLLCNWLDGFVMVVVLLILSLWFFSFIDVELCFVLFVLILDDILVSKVCKFLCHQIRSCRLFVLFWQIYEFLFHFLSLYTF
jgi:hypothetical protein